MKKISGLLFVMVMLLTVTGCGEDVIATKTCSKQNEQYYETYKLTATNDEIDHVELTFVYDNAMFNVDTLATLTEDQKEQIKTNMLTTLGLESATYEGFEITIDIKDQMTVVIEADLEKADAEVLKKVGLDFSNADMSLKRAVKDLEKQGSTCE